ncbi:MAG: porin, partial [Thermodesulfobacteriota bacterium]
MRTLLKLLFIAVLAVPISGVTAKAQSSQQQQIEELKQQIQAIQMQNQQQIEQLKQEIQQLENARAQSDKNLAQINQKQVTAEDAWYNKFLGKYDSGFVFETKDSSGIPFKLRFSILAQTQFYVSKTTAQLSGCSSLGCGDQATQTSGKLRRLEIKWDGYAFAPWFYYTFMIDPTKTNGTAPYTNTKILQDMYLTAAYYKEISPRVGQWKVPFQREELTPSSSLQFVERSIV